MRKKFVNYYSLIILTLFILFNIVLDNLKFDGILYLILIILINIFHTIFILKNIVQIKYKKFVFPILFILLPSSNSIYHFLYAFSSIILLAMGCSSKTTKIMIFLLTLASLPYLFFCLLLSYDLVKQEGLDDIYEDTHYYCNNNYEIYSYSSGMLDSFHYSIGKHYEFLNIDDIIYIAYRERNEITKDEYDNYISNHNCYLVGEQNGYR